jgi:hypothetical protein
MMPDDPQIGRGAVHDRPFVRRNAFVGALPDDFQSLGQHGQILVMNVRSRSAERTHNSPPTFSEVNSAP